MRSLVNHIDELRVLLATSPIDVLTINETWLNSTISDNDVYILYLDTKSYVVTGHLEVQMEKRMEVFVFMYAPA